MTTMTTSEMIAWVMVGFVGAALLAYVAWQIWMAVKRSRKPIAITVSRTGDGGVFVHSDVGPERLDVTFDKDVFVGRSCKATRHYWCPQELSVTVTPNATRPSKTGR